MGKLKKTSKAGKSKGKKLSASHERVRREAHAARRRAIVRDLEEKARQLRAHVLISIFAAGSGHPGGSLSVADIATVLFGYVARLNPWKRSSPDRDRIFFSAGHKAPALYAGLALAGYHPMHAIHTLRRFDSIFQGHPHSLKCPGVEISSGSLGQGLGVAVGAALGLRLSESRARVYCVMGDGEQQEGSVWEAAMAAGHYKLDNLTAFVDCNGLQIDGKVENVMNIHPLGSKYRAFGWNVIECDGNDMDELLTACDKALAAKGKPTVIVARTVKGKGVSFMENEAGWHGKAIGSREQLDKALSDVLKSHVYPKETLDAWLAEVEDFSAGKTRGIEASFPAQPTYWWNEAADMKADMQATRQGFGKALAAIGCDERIVTIHVDISNSICIDQFEKDCPDRKKRVFSLGIAEQNMLQVAAGLANTGRIPVTGDYGVFASGRAWDQLRTTICYPNMNVKIAGAHAGISVGPDGATHQALEEISLLAQLPNMTLLVPGDILETEKLTRLGVLDVKGPVYLRFAREATPVISKADTPCVLGKANVIRFRGRAARFVDAFQTVLASDYVNENEKIALIACGPMVPEAMRAAWILKEKYGFESRVLNISTVKPLDEESIRRAVAEIGLIVTEEEHQVGGFGNLVAGAAARLKQPKETLRIAMVGVADRFGESGKPWELMKAFGLTAEYIVAKALELLKS